MKIKAEQLEEGVRCEVEIIPRGFRGIYFIKGPTRDPQTKSWNILIKLYTSDLGGPWPGGGTGNLG